MKMVWRQLDPMIAWLLVNIAYPEQTLTGAYLSHLSIFLAIIRVRVFSKL